MTHPLNLVAVDGFQDGRGLQHSGDVDDLTRTAFVDIFEADEVELPLGIAVVVAVGVGVSSRLDVAVVAEDGFVFDVFAGVPGVGGPQFSAVKTFPT